MKKMLCKDNFKGIGFLYFHDSPWKNYSEKIYGWSGIGCKNLSCLDVKKLNIDCAGCFDVVSSGAMIVRYMLRVVGGMIFKLLMC